MISAIQIKGTEKVTVGLASLPRKLRAEVRKSVASLTTRTKAVAKSLAPVSAYGSTYKFSRSGKRLYLGKHFSQSGAAVHTASGFLSRTIKGKTRTYAQRAPIAIIGRVYSLLYVARYQEYGTKRMRGNTFLRPALERMSSSARAELISVTKKLAQETF